MTFLVSYVKESPSLPHTLKSLLVSLFADDFLVPSIIEKGKWSNFILIPFCKPHPFHKRKKSHYALKLRWYRTIHRKGEWSHYALKLRRYRTIHRKRKRSHYVLILRRYRTIHRKGKSIHRKGERSHYALIIPKSCLISRESQRLHDIMTWQNPAYCARMGGKIATGATWIPSTEGFMLYLWTGRPRQS